MVVPLTAITVIVPPVSDEPGQSAGAARWDELPARGSLAPKLRFGRPIGDRAVGGVAVLRAWSFMAMDSAKRDFAAPDTAMAYPWKHFIGGHMGRLGTRADMVLYQQYVNDIIDGVKKALGTVDPTRSLPRRRAAGAVRPGTSCCSTARRRSKTATCEATPPSSAWT